MKFFSPLRYPGGKLKVSQYIKLLIDTNNLNDGHYVEPYAGGASVALDLLINEYVSNIHINDIDLAIYSFWHSTLYDTENFCKLINDTVVSVEEWKKQKFIIKNKDQFSALEIGFSTFFLNRTNRSGILNAGMIGGNEQTGNWKIDARYNKTDLIKRIELINRFEDRISLNNMDAVEYVQMIDNTLPNNTLIYLDPPYYKKGKELYINYYNHEDHKEIADVVKKLTNRYWLVSYDNETAIKELYSGFRQKIYSLNYSVGKASKGSEVIIYNDKLFVPEIENPTDKKEISNFIKSEIYL
ncbi:DNA adenine methylase [Flavobacterium defluvii]|uniref:DNA adenine methylase n=1 Tax=Flavobacterium defluvii TaxID=370979 RepID=A0A1M5J1U0_9FLAO|nr:DNA adenine methylase [Flavobacterium defluvii]SHG34557.1 DNA adenine methylase [Flavobacterium defluvii]